MEINFKIKLMIVLKFFDSAHLNRSIRRMCKCCKCLLLIDEAQACKQGLKGKWFGFGYRLKLLTLKHTHGFSFWLLTSAYSAFGSANSLFNLWQFIAIHRNLF